MVRTVVLDGGRPLGPSGRLGAIGGNCGGVHRHGLQAEAAERMAQSSPFSSERDGFAAIARQWRYLEMHALQRRGRLDARPSCLADRAPNGGHAESSSLDVSALHGASDEAPVAPSAKG